jgi:predicted RNA-binding protein with PUA-like domain
MKAGDLVLFYHSNDNAGIVGTASVSKEFYQDPTTNDDAWVSVELKCGIALKKPVALSEIKAEKKLKNMLLLKIGRLSVMPVTREEFEKVMEMGGG